MDGRGQCQPRFCTPSLCELPEGLQAEAPRPPPPPPRLQGRIKGPGYSVPLLSRTCKP